MKMNEFQLWLWKAELLAKIVVETLLSLTDVRTTMEEKTEDSLEET